MNQQATYVPRVKRRDMLAQGFLMNVTFRFYAFHWGHETYTELQDISGDRYTDPGLMTILMFLPFFSLHAMFKYAELWQ